jgi:hypothetical protein
MEIDRNLQIVILVFVGLIVIFYKQKPSMMFKNGKPKQFGSGKEKTITPVWLVALSLSLLFYIQLTIKNDDFV